MRYGLWLLVVAVVLGAAGLVHASGRTGPPPPPDPRPFDGVTYFTAEQTSALHDATERELVRCMRERGFTYHAVPDADRSRAAAASPYLLLQAARADTDGYGITGHALAARPAARSRNEAVLAELPEHRRQQWRDALTGTPAHTETIRLPDGTSVSYPADGCMFAARELLYGTGWEQRFYRFQGYSNLVIQRTTADPRYAAAVTEWAACLRSLGHQYADLDDSRADITGRLAAAGDDPQRLRDVARLELDTAHEDLRCQRQARLHEAVASAQRDAENAILTDALRLELVKLRDARQAALRLASDPG